MSTCSCRPCNVFLVCQGGVLLYTNWLQSRLFMSVHPAFLRSSQNNFEDTLFTGGTLMYQGLDLSLSEIENPILLMMLLVGWSLFFLLAFEISCTRPQNAVILFPTDGKSTKCVCANFSWQKYFTCGFLYLQIRTKTWHF